MTNSRMLKAVTLFLTMTLYVQALGEIKSGMIEVSDPVSKSFYVDFSDQIMYKTNTISDSVSADSADLIFTNQSIDAPYGVQAVSIQEFYQKYIKGKILSNSSDIPSYLDTVAKEFKLSRASLTIVDTIQKKANIASDTVMLVKTREGGVALLMRVFMYIGGINRYRLYWIYQSSGETAFYKNDLIPAVDSLSITLNIFSGRPDPVFTIKNKQFATEIIKKLSFSFNKLLNPAAQIQAWDTSSSFGSISSIWIQKIASDSEFPAYHIINDKIFYHKMPPAISSSTPPAIQHNNYELLRLIIKLGILNNIETSDMYGVIRFKDLFPENILSEIDTCSIERLKQLLSGQTGFQYNEVTQSQYKSLCKVTMKTSVLTLETIPGFLNCAIFGIDGTVVSRTNQQTSGRCIVPIDNKAFGIFFVKGTVTSENGLINKLSLRVVR